MGIRIDPTLEFVWRDPATVQLGVDPPRAVVPVPTTGEERFLSALRSETGREALSGVAAAAGCPPEVAARVLGAASPAVVDVLPSHSRASRCTAPVRCRTPSPNCSPARA